MKSITPLVTDLMGAKLKTQEGEEIGVVQNMRLNPSMGNTIFIFLCYADFIGKVHRHLAIPYEQLKYKQDKGAVYFEIDKRSLRDRLRINVSDGAESAEREELDSMFDLFLEEEIPETVVTG